MIIGSQPYSRTLTTFPPFARGAVFVSIYFSFPSCLLHFWLKMLNN
nr:MAG TPA: hypothetical protein [Caudoviricetes sp.]